MYTSTIHVVQQVCHSLCTSRLSPAEAKISTLYNHINSCEIPATQKNEDKMNHRGESSDKDQANNTAVPQTNKQTCPSLRWKEHLEACQNVLLEWCCRTWYTEFKNCVWGLNILLIWGGCSQSLEAHRLVLA
jgi:hypothetical protein